MLQTATSTDTAAARTPAADSPRVRSACPDDLPQLMDICRQLHAENGVANVDWRGVAAKMLQGIAQHQALIGVIGSVGQLEAAIFMQISSFWYSTDVMLEELFAYVLPSYRRSNNAKALLDFARDCSDRLDVPLLIGIISNHRTREKVRLYSRRMGAPSGAFFLYGAKTGCDSEAGDI